MWKLWRKVQDPMWKAEKDRLPEQWDLDRAGNTVWMLVLTETVAKAAEAFRGCCRVDGCMSKCNKYW